MTQKGSKPKRIWSPELAYAIGLIATDGCLSKDGRHVALTSKDKEQILTLKEILNLKNKIGITYSGGRKTLAYRIQFGDARFYRRLLLIGLTPAKTKTIGALHIPEKYLFDFLRGHHDGDGTFYSYWDPRWHSSFMFYLTFVSASKIHIGWLRSTLQGRLQVKGHVTKAKTQSVYQLKYAKRESLRILRKMYYKKNIICLKRKRLKIERALRIVGEHL